MSRIILKEFPGTDEHHIVVGWDRPCASYFWQEFNVEPKVIEDNEGWKVVSPSVPAIDGKTYKSKQEAEEHQWDGWQEMVRFAGYMPSEIPTLKQFMDGLPEDFKPLVTDEVQELLVQHSMDADAGRILVNMVPKSWKVEVQTLDNGDRWASNSVRFATEGEAEQAALDLAGRWTMVKEYRAAPSSDPVNYKWEGGKAVSV